jgi:hypothetical protein
MDGWATVSRLDSRFRLFRSEIGAAMNSDFPLGGLLRFTKLYFLSHLIFKSFPHGNAQFNMPYNP